MNFLIIIILLALYWYLPEKFSLLQNDKYLLWWRNWVLEKKDHLKLGTLFVFLLPLLVLVFIFLPWIEHRFLGIVYLLLSAALLAYAIGRIPLQGLFDSYLKEWKSGQARHMVSELGGDAQGATETDQQLHAFARERLFYNVLEQLFCVVFWFALTGLFIPLLYRALDILSKREDQIDATSRSIFMSDKYNQLIAVIEWLPSIVLAGLLNCVADTKWQGLSSIKDTVLGFSFKDIPAQLHQLGSSALSFMPVETLQTEQEIEDFYPQAEKELSDIKLNVYRVFVLFVCLIALLHILCLIV